MCEETSHVFETGSRKSFNGASHGPDWEHWVATVDSLVYRGHTNNADAASKLAALLATGNKAGYVRSAMEADSEQWIDVRDHLVDNGYELVGTQIEPMHQQSILLVTDGSI